MPKGIEGLEGCESCVQVKDMKFWMHEENQ